MERQEGYLEETYWIYGFSPVQTRSGKVEGVFASALDGTSQYIGDRRLKTLRDLSTQSAHALTVSTACDIVGLFLFFIFHIYFFPSLFLNIFIFLR